MVVGVCTIDLHLPGINSLKAKRQILLSLKERIHRKFNVSIAEVDSNDLWQRAELGIACVANDGRYVNQILDGILNAVHANPSIEIIRHHMELL